MSAVAEALARLRQQRDALNGIDDELRDVIRMVEETFASLQPGVPVTISYDRDASRLSYEKLDGHWTIVVGSATSPNATMTPLLRASRASRAAVFRPESGGLSPLERLVVAAVESIEKATQERSPMLEVARRLAKTIKSRPT